MMISQVSTVFSSYKINNGKCSVNRCLQIPTCDAHRGDSVSFSGKSSITKKHIKQAIEEKVAIIGDGTKVEFYSSPNLKDQARQSVYDLNTKTFKINTANIKTKLHLNTVLEKICLLSVMASLYSDDIKEHVETFAKEYGIEEPFIPSVELCVVSEVGRRGMYFPANNVINVNVESFVQSDYLLPMIISHEMSHCKSFSDFSLIKPEDIPECCHGGMRQNAFYKVITLSDCYDEYRKYRQNRNPVDQNSIEYKRILHNYKQFLDDVEHNKDPEQFEEALARTNSAITCKKLIHNPCHSLMACIKDEIGKFKALVLRRDQEVRGLIVSGELQLDEETIGHIKHDNNKYRLDLSKQKN